MSTDIYLPGLGVRAQELCESFGGRPGLPVRNRPYGLCRRKATLKLDLVQTAWSHKIRNGDSPVSCVRDGFRTLYILYNARSFFVSFC